MLKDAIESVLIQDFKELEHIIIDNGSTDETSRIVEDYAREFPNIHFISLPKPNLPRAINEGLIKSRGRVIGILCDDDLYPQGALQAIAQVFHDNKEVDIVSTGIQIVRNIGNQFIVEKEAYPKFSVHDLLFHTPYESARFLRRSLIYKVGLLNEDLGVSSQREWLLRIALTDPKIFYLNRVCYILRRHSHSLTWNFDPYSKLKWLPNHIRIARHYLKVVNDVNLRQIFKEWSNRQSYAGFRLSLKRGMLKKSLWFIIHGHINDPAMTSKILCQAIKRRTKRHGYAH